MVQHLYRTTTNRASLLSVALDFAVCSSCTASLVLNAIPRSLPRSIACYLSSPQREGACVGHVVARVRTYDCVCTCVSVRCGSACALGCCCSVCSSLTQCLSVSIDPCLSVCVWMSLRTRSPATCVQRVTAAVQSRASLASCSSTALSPDRRPEHDPSDTGSMAKGASSAAAASTGVSSILADFQAKYTQTTPTKIKLIDGFLAYVLATGILQFIYCALVGTFPFNSFLAGFVCTVGVFVLGGASTCSSCCFCCCYHRDCMRCHESVDADSSCERSCCSLAANADQPGERVQGPQ